MQRNIKKCLNTLKEDGYFTNETIHLIINNYTHRWNKAGMFKLRNCVIGTFEAFLVHNIVININIVLVLSAMLFLRSEL